MDIHAIPTLEATISNSVRIVCTYIFTFLTRVFKLEWQDLTLFYIQFFLGNCQTIFQSHYNIL